MPDIESFLIHRVFGHAYAVVSRVGADGEQSAPFAVALGDLRAAPSYEQLIVDAYADAIAAPMKAGSTVIMTGDGTLRDGLPRYDIVVDDGMWRTLGATVIAKGWAVPSATIDPSADRGMSAEAIEAMQVARTAHAGAWGQWDAHAFASTVHFGLEARTRPKSVEAGIDQAFSAISVVALIALVAVMVFRDIIVSANKTPRRRGFFAGLGRYAIGAYGPAGYAGIDGDDIRRAVAVDGDGRRGGRSEPAETVAVSAVDPPNQPAASPPPA